MNTATLALLFAAWIGHAFALTVLLNVAYAHPIHRRILRVLRLLIGVAVFSFGLTFPWLIAELSSRPLRFDAITVYIAICLFIGLVVLPVQTMRRCLRREPLAVAARSSRVVDFATELKGRPLGFGKHWRLARLPGNQILQVEFTELTLQMPRLPAAWDGLTILHLTDLHFHGSPDRSFFTALFNRILEWGTPDLVCLTGDYVDTVRHMFWIKPLLGRLKWREAGLAVLGNHDYWCRPNRVRRELRRAGYDVLGNGHKMLTIRGERLLAVGHEGPWFRPAPDLQIAEEHGFKLLLSHTPDTIGWARDAGVDLMFAGHVHGGQIRLPVIGSLFVPSRYSRKYDGGVFWEPPTLMCVSRGISGREPLRWNCRPEVTWVTLRAGAKMSTVHNG